MWILGSTVANTTAHQLLPRWEVGPQSPVWCSQTSPSRLTAWNATAAVSVFINAYEVGSLLSD